MYKAVNNIYFSNQLMWPLFSWDLVHKMWEITTQKPTVIIIIVIRPKQKTIAFEKLEPQKFWNFCFKKRTSTIDQLSKYLPINVLLINQMSEDIHRIVFCITSTFTIDSWTLNRSFSSSVFNAGLFLLVLFSYCSSTTFTQTQDPNAHECY